MGCWDCLTGDKKKVCHSAPCLSSSSHSRALSMYKALTSTCRVNEWADLWKDESERLLVSGLHREPGGLKASWGWGVRPGSCWPDGLGISEGTGITPLIWKGNKKVGHLHLVILTDSCGYGAACWEPAGIFLSFLHPYCPAKGLPWHRQCLWD
jgi:hypothetical protein